MVTQKQMLLIRNEFEKDFNEMKEEIRLLKHQVKVLRQSNDYVRVKLAEKQVTL